MGETLCHSLVKATAAGREEHHVRSTLSARRNVANRLEDRRRLHQHALAPAKRRIVNRAMPVMGPVPEVVRLKREDAFSLRTPHDRGIQVGREDARKDREGLNNHWTSPPSTRPEGTRTRMAPVSGTSKTTSSTTGTSTMTSSMVPRKPRLSSVTSRPKSASAS